MLSLWLVDWYIIMFFGLIAGKGVLQPLGRGERFKQGLGPDKTIF